MITSPLHLAVSFALLSLSLAHPRPVPAAPYATSLTRVFTNSSKEVNIAVSVEVDVSAPTQAAAVAGVDILVATGTGVGIAVSTNAPGVVVSTNVGISSGAVVGVGVSGTAGMVGTAGNGGTTGAAGQTASNMSSAACLSLIDDLGFSLEDVESAIANDSIESIAGSNDIPDVTLDDALFVLCVLPTLLEVEAAEWEAFIDALNLETDLPDLTRRQSSTTNSTTGRVDDTIPVTNNTAGPNTQAKWQAWQMDKWLAAYVRKINVYGSSTKLIDSQTFLLDFWQSTGEEGQNPCGSLGSDSCTARFPNPAETVPFLSYDDRLRAYFVRVAIANWRNGAKDAREVFQFSASDSQLSIVSIRNAFTASYPTEPGDSTDLMLSVLGVVGALIPPIAPAISVVSGVVAVGQALSARQTTGSSDSNSNGNPSARPGHDPDLFNIEEESNRESSIEEESMTEMRRVSVSVAEVQVKAQSIATETETIKSTSEWQSWAKTQGSKYAGDVLTKAAKVIVGIKSINRGFTKAPTSSWDGFDLRMQTLLGTYAETVEKAFEANKNSYEPNIVQDADSSLGVVGMAALLQGGQWFAFRNNQETISKIQNKLKAFFRKIILSQVLKQQSVFFTTQFYADVDSCNRHRNTETLSGQDYLWNDDTSSCAQVKNGWELRTINRPIGDYSGERYVHYLQNSEYNVYFARINDNNHTDSWWQRFSNYNFQRSLFPNLLDSRLKTNGIDLSFNQIFDLAQACQNAHGDPFDKAVPTTAELYPSMTIDASSVLDGNENSNPLCLFALPVFDMAKTSNNDWCRHNVLEKTQIAWYCWHFPNQECRTPAYKMISASAKMCGQDGFGRGTGDGDFGGDRPGCAAFNGGFYNWRREFNYGKDCVRVDD